MVNKNIVVKLTVFLLVGMGLCLPAEHSEAYSGKYKKLELKAEPVKGSYEVAEPIKINMWWHNPTEETIKNVLIPHPDKLGGAMGPGVLDPVPRRSLDPKDGVVEPNSSAKKYTITAGVGLSEKYLRYVGPGEHTFSWSVKGNDAKVTVSVENRSSNWKQKLKKLSYLKNISHAENADTFVKFSNRYINQYSSSDWIDFRVRELYINKLLSDRSTRENYNAYEPGTLIESTLDQFNEPEQKKRLKKSKFILLKQKNNLAAAKFVLKNRNHLSDMHLDAGNSVRAYPLKNEMSLVTRLVREHLKLSVESIKRPGIGAVGITTGEYQRTLNWLSEIEEEFKSNEKKKYINQLRAEIHATLGNEAKALSYAREISNKTERWFEEVINTN